MSWKYYSSPYTAREEFPTKDSSQLKFGLSSARFAGAPAEPKSLRFCHGSAEPVEHSPVWAKTNIGNNPASVQRLKERYNISEEPRRDIKPIKKAETKDLTAASPSTSLRRYGRSLTTQNFGDVRERNAKQSKFGRNVEKTSQVEISTYDAGVNSKSSDGRHILYMPSATAKLLTRKYSNELSPITATVTATSKSSMKEIKTCDDEIAVTVTMVTRGTSPTPTPSAIYLRSKRTDFGLEKKVLKPFKKPNTANKEVQTDRDDLFCSKYVAYPESTGRSRLRLTQADICCSGNPYNPKPTKTIYGDFPRRDQRSSYFGSGQTDNRRSTSREESEDATTPDSPQKSLTSKPPTLTKTPPTSPVKNSDKKNFTVKVHPTNIRPPLKPESTNGSSPSSHLSAVLQCKMAKVETLHTPEKSSARHSPPKVILERCPDIPQVLDDVSSMSESSEEETTSDEDAESATLTVKKSVTNFLQNIPNPSLQNQSKTNVFQKVNNLSPQKVNFKRIESGERAWWMESSERVPPEIAVSPSLRQANSDADNQELQPPSPHSFLSPPNLINRQFSRDKDWLKASSDNIIETTNKFSPKGNPPSSRNEENGREGAKILANGDFKGNVDDSLAVRAKELNKSSDNLLPKDLNNQMKFNQRCGDSLKGERNFVTDFPRDCSGKDVAQKLHNGLGNLLDENYLESGDMSGLISKAKAELAKSKSKLDIKKSSSREMSPKASDNKPEIDLYWKELADSLNRPLHLCDLDFTDLNSDDDADVLGHLKSNGEVPPPPPPMLILPPPWSVQGKTTNALAPVPPFEAGQPSRGPKPAAPSPGSQNNKNKKTVKLFWKEVKDEFGFQSKLSDGATLIWDEMAKVKVDTQKLEYLFESRAKDLISKKQQEQNKNKEIIVLDPKRSNAINIGMTKLPPPRAIKTAILKMDSTVVNKEGIEKILSMLPTEEEKIRIQEAQNGNPDIPLGSAEQFLLTLTSISELEARLKLWAFKLGFENSEKEICEPLMDLKQGMEILKMNQTFRAILSTLLSVGNFLNGYDVKGFQIDYLTKVPEVKDTVHKHSLLHHLCIIVMDKFPESTDLYSEIGAVTRASKVDFDELAANIKTVEEECKLSWNYLKMIAKHEGHTAMKVKMSDFLADCAERIIVINTIHKRIMSRFQKFAFWLGVPGNKISTTRPNEMFKTISEFALEYRTTRDRVLLQIKKMNREKSRSRGYLTSDIRDSGLKKINSKEAKDDARLKELLGGDFGCSEDSTGSSTCRRRQRKNTKNLLVETNNNEDEEILETLIKTANQVPSSRAALKERRRSRVYGKYCK